MITTQNRGIRSMSVAAAPVKEAAAVVVEVATVGVRANPMITRRNVMNKEVILLDGGILFFYLLYAPFHLQSGERECDGQAFNTSLTMTAPIINIRNIRM